MTDTSARAEAAYFERLRATPPRERLERALRLSEQVRRATFRRIREAHPGATEAELKVLFVRQVYGDALADRLARQLAR